MFKRMLFRHSFTTISSCIATVLLLLTSAHVDAQAPTGPARLNVVAPRQVLSGSKGRLDIMLVDAVGQPTKADRDVVLHVSAPGAKIDQETVVIPKGQASAQVDVSRTEAGVANVQVEQVKTATPILSATTSISFSPESSYTPVLPLRISLSVEPRTQLLAGVERGAVVASLVDRNNVPFQVGGNVEVSFPGLGGLVTPNPIRILAGSSHAEGTLTSGTPASYTLRPIVSPSVLLGRPVKVENVKVEFVSPIGGVHIVSEAGDYVQRVWRPRLPLKFWLVDVKGAHVKADIDRTIDVHVDPPDLGIIEPAEVIIPVGSPSAEADYIPLKEGKGTITGLAMPSLKVGEVTIEFRYRFLLFGLVAFGGGLLGGFLRVYRGDRRSGADFLKSSLIGSVTGVLLYLLLPLVITLGFKPASFQAASKIFEAFTWGIMGGLAGPATIRAILERRFGLGAAAAGSPVN
jgi:hypothetical protein